jgi:hypothetical protein
MICTAIYAQINTKTEVGGSLSPGDAIDRFCTGLLDSRRSRKAPQGCRLRSDNGRLPISTLVDPSPSAQTVPTRALKRVSSLLLQTEVERGLPIPLIVRHQHAWEAPLTAILESIQGPVAQSPPRRIAAFHARHGFGHGSCRSGGDSFTERSRASQRSGWV